MLEEIHADRSKQRDLYKEVCKEKLKDSFKEICEAQGDAIRGEYEDYKNASEDTQEDDHEGTWDDSIISHWDGLEEIYAEDEALGEIFEANEDI